MALKLLLESLHLLTKLIVLLLEILSHTDSSLILFFLFVHSLVHLLEYDPVRLALLLLRLFAVNQRLSKDFDFFDHVFALKIDKLGLVSGVLGAVLGKDVLKQFLDDALLLLG